MTESIEEMEAAELLANASYSAGRLERLSEQTNAHFVSTSGWLTASIFAINGGGLLAALNAADRLKVVWLSPGLFGLGIVFAMLNAVVVQEMLQRTINATEPIINYWRLVEALGTAKPAVYDGLAEIYRKAVRWGWLAPVMGWISGLCFIAGGIAFAADTSHRSASMAVTCSTLQQDMLRGSPTSANSRETFSALSCRYQD